MSSLYQYQPPGSSRHWDSSLKLLWVSIVVRILQLAFTDVDHRTLSVYFANGRFVDVAKIEGSEAYKACVNSGNAHWTHGKSFDDAKAKTARAYKPHVRGSHGTGRASHQMAAPWYFSLSRYLCKHRPQQEITTDNPVRPMLQALLAAGQSFLKEDVDSILVGTLITGNFDEMHRYVSLALAEMKTNGQNRFFNLPGRINDALGLENDCDDVWDTDVDEYEIMAIEYTRSSLVGQISTELCGLYMTESTVSSSGYDKSTACRKASAEPEACDVSLKSVLRKLIRATSNSRYNLTLNALVVYGERAHDEDFLMVLNHTLKDNFVNVTSVHLGQAKRLSPDLAFVGSRAMAKHELAEKDFQRRHAGERDEL